MLTGLWYGAMIVLSALFASVVVAIVVLWSSDFKYVFYNVWCFFAGLTDMIIRKLLGIK